MILSIYLSFIQHLFTHTEHIFSSGTVGGHEGEEGEEKESDRE
jgi:hypothetical protein